MKPALAALLLTGCMPSLHAHPLPIGKPGPMECYAAKQARTAWLEVIVPYVSQGFAEQEAYSCQPVPEAPKE